MFHLKQCYNSTSSTFNSMIFIPVERISKKAQNELILGALDFKVAARRASRLAMSKSNKLLNC